MNDTAVSREQSHRQVRLPLELIGREAWGAFRVALALLLAGAFVAVLLLGWKLGAIGTFVAFCIMSFVGLPMWLASLQDDLAHLPPS